MGAAQTETAFCGNGETVLSFFQAAFHFSGCLKMGETPCFLMVTTLILIRIQSDETFSFKRIGIGCGSHFCIERVQQQQQ